MRDFPHEREKLVVVAKLEQERTGHGFEVPGRIDASVEYIDEMFRQRVINPETGETEAAFEEITRKIVQHVYDQAYMLFVPTPNNVFAVNKEVVFEPYRMACFPLWNIQISDQHWSVRESRAYPNELKRPVEITRIIFDEEPTP